MNVRLKLLFQFDRAVLCNSELVIECFNCLVIICHV